MICFYNMDPFFLKNKGHTRYIHRPVVKVPLFPMPIHFLKYEIHKSNMKQSRVFTTLTVRGRLKYINVLFTFITFTLSPLLRFPFFSKHV